MKLKAKPLKIKLWRTQYKAGDGCLYGSGIWAPSKLIAERRAMARGLGELILGYCDSPGILDIPASEILEAKHKSIDAIHALVWTMRLALASGVAGAGEFLDDDSGILHQYIHHRSGLANKNRFGEILAKLRQIEQKIPGHLPR